MLISLDNRVMVSPLSDTAIFPNMFQNDIVLLLESSKCFVPKVLMLGIDHAPKAKKPRVVRGLRLPQGLLSRFEVFVLAETEGFEPSMRLYTPYSLSRGAPSATRSRFLKFRVEIMS